MNIVVGIYMKIKSSKRLNKLIPFYIIGIVLFIVFVLVGYKDTIASIISGKKESFPQYTISGVLPEENTFYIGDYTPGIPYNDDVRNHVKPNYRALFVTSWTIRYGIGLPDDEFEGQILNGYPRRLKGSIDFRKITNTVSYGKPDKLVSNVLDEAFYALTDAHFVLFYSPPESPIASSYYYLYEISRNSKPRQLSAFDTKQFDLDVDARIEPLGEKYIIVSFGKTPHMNCWGNEKYLVNVQSGKMKKIGEVVEISTGASDTEITFKRVVKRPSFQCSSGGYELTLDHKIENEINTAYGNVVHMDLIELD